MVAREIFPQAFERISCQKLDFVLGEHSMIEASPRDFFPEFLFFLEFMFPGIFQTLERLSLLSKT